MNQPPYLVGARFNLWCRLADEGDDCETALTASTLPDDERCDLARRLANARSLQASAIVLPRARRTDACAAGTRLTVEALRRQREYADEPSDFWPNVLAGAIGLAAAIAAVALLANPALWPGWGP